MSGRVGFEAFFLPGSRGRLFALHFEPASKEAELEAVLLMPPLMEELNKTRPMLAAQARRLAARGYRVLMLDLHGTGDSEGDFRDARMEIWSADLATGARWLMQTGARAVHLWAVRGGALLIEDLLKTAVVRTSVLVLWQPVHTGRQLVTQWLRLRLAAEAEQRRAPSGDDLRRLLAESRALEVAGYEISGDLVEGLERRHFSEALGADWYGIAWIDIVAEGSGAPPASERLVKSLHGAGRLRYETLVGPPFWGTPEIARMPALLDVTTRYFEDVRGPDS